MQTPNRLHSGHFLFEGTDEHPPLKTAMGSDVSILTFSIYPQYKIIRISQLYSENRCSDEHVCILHLRRIMRWQRLRKSVSPADLIMSQSLLQLLPPLNVLLHLACQPIVAERKQHLEKDESNANNANDTKNKDDTRITGRPIICHLFLFHQQIMPIEMMLPINRRQSLSKDIFPKRLCA